MKEKGFMIDREGVVSAFGSYNGINTLESGHKKSFEEDVVDTPYFQSLNLTYDKSKTIYSNAQKLSLEGIIFVFNHQLAVFSPTQITSYVPKKPTRKQLNSLIKMQEEIDKIEIKKLYEFRSLNYNDATEYSSFKDYIVEKNKMVEQGIVIFPNGTSLSFGTHFCPDEPEYKTAPIHVESFQREILPSTEFRLSDYIYDDNHDLYYNALRFSLEGLIIIFNKQLSTTDPTEILAYVPNGPTEEQLTSLKENEILAKIEIQNVREFNSLDLNDKVKYAGLTDYINQKQRSHLNKM